MSELAFFQYFRDTQEPLNKLFAGICRELEKTGLIVGFPVNLSGTRINDCIHLNGQQGNVNGTYLITKKVLDMIPAYFTTERLVEKLELTWAGLPRADRYQILLAIDKVINSCGNASIVIESDGKVCIEDGNWRHFERFDHEHWKTLSVAYFKGLMEDRLKAIKDQKADQSEEKETKKQRTDQPEVDKSTIAPPNSPNYSPSSPAGGDFEEKKCPACGKFDSPAYQPDSPTD